MKQLFFSKQLFHVSRILYCLFMSYMLFYAIGCSSPISSHAQPSSPLTSDTILLDEDIRNTTLQIIQEATQFLYIEQVAIDDPVLLNQIIAQAKAGVEVKILLDRWQPENIPTTALLKNNNISTQYYPTEKGQFHHQKFIIADNKTVLFLSTPWISSSSPFASLAFIMHGDTVQKALDTFIRDWQYTTIVALNRNSVDDPSCAPEEVTLTSTIGIKNLILSHIEKANETIFIETQQITEEDDLLRTLIAAHNRGCQINILLDPLCQTTTPTTITALARANIECRYVNVPDNMLNRNFAVFDSFSVIYTSSPWTYNTFIINHENALSIPSPSVAQRCIDIFQSDWENAIQ